MMTNLVNMKTVLLHKYYTEAEPKNCQMWKMSKFITEMEYYASAASMLVEEIWKIAEGFVKAPANKG